MHRGDGSCGLDDLGSQNGVKAQRPCHVGLPRAPTVCADSLITLRSQAAIQLFSSSKTALLPSSSMWWMPGTTDIALGSRRS